MNPAQTLALVDDGQGAWGPLCDLRAVFEQRSGAWTTRQRIEHHANQRAHLLRVPAALLHVVQQRYPDVTVNRLSGPTHDVSWLLVHAGCSHPLLVAEALALRVGHVLLSADRMVALHTADPHVATAVLERGEWTAPAKHQMSRTSAAGLLFRPWHVLEQLDATLRADLGAIDLPPLDPQRAAAGQIVQVGDHPIKVAPDARLHPLTVLNAEKGPIVVDARAVVGSFSVLAGPCYVGPGSIVSPHTHFRALSVAGPTCVLGGEISQSIIYGYSNKAHAGYLGNSLVGKWVNLGADTNVSNLKNTYGSVRMQLEKDKHAEDSGQQKLGPIIGDFVRTAIGSRLLTGSCIGTGAMVAASGFAPKFVPRGAFLTDEGLEPTRIDKFLATAQKMMQRRGVALTPAEEERLTNLFAANAK